LFQQSANLSCPEGQYMLARRYGENLPISEQIKLFTPAAIKGLREAQYELGYLDFKNNPELAVYWLTQSANQKFPPAQYFLGLCYLNGDGGLKKDPQKGIE